MLDKARDLGAEAAAGSLALFLGGGVSVPSGLPSWTQLVEEVRAAAVRRGANIPDREFAAMGLLDQTELLHTVLRGDLESIVAERFRSATPALSHALLASLRCVESVTTNYDDCYETAVAAQDPHTRLVVMPWQKPDGGRPWLLKLHGDARRPETVVLTRGQFIGYDSRWRPVGSVFQSLLMTRKLLVVGASLSDDNVLRLAHEVRALRQRHDIEEPLGYVLSLGPEPMRAQLWSGELEWVALDGPTAEDQARSLEIFLDAVLTHATHGAPYLLHPDFADLLDGTEEAELADLARSLAARIAEADCERRLRHDAGWPEILAMLRSFGAEV